MGGMRLVFGIVSLLISAAGFTVAGALSLWFIRDFDEDRGVYSYSLTDAPRLLVQRPDKATAMLIFLGIAVVFLVIGADFIRQKRSKPAPESGG